MNEIKEVVLFLITILLAYCGVVDVSVNIYPPEYIYDYYDYALARELEFSNTYGVASDLARLEINKLAQNYYYPRAEEMAQLELLYATADQEEILRVGRMLRPSEGDVPFGDLEHIYLGLRFVAEDGREAYFPVQIYEHVASITFMPEKGNQLSGCRSKALKAYLLEKGVIQAATAVKFINTR